MAREPLTASERKEFTEDFAEGFRDGLINEQQYRNVLHRALGMNATEIEEEVRRNRPPQ